MLLNQGVNVDKLGYFDFGVNDGRFLSALIFEGEGFYHNLMTIHWIK